jgi:DNA mismatch repair protein MutS
LTQIFADLRRRLRRPAARAIAEEPAALVRDGGVIAPALTPSWTSCAPSRPTATPSCWSWKPASARTGIANLRVQFNKVHGFYIEVTSSQPTRCRTTTAAARR